MSPFWNHILANLGLFIHVPSWILWYVCCMYLGTKGGFFQTCVFWSPSLLLRGSFTTMCTNSNTPCFLRMTTCVCVFVVTSSPHHHRPSAITTRRLRLSSFQPIAHDFISPINHTPNISRRHWIHITIMAKKPPPLRVCDDPCFGRQSLEFLVIDIWHLFCWYGCIDHPPHCIDHLPLCCCSISCVQCKSLYSFLASWNI